MDIIDDIKDIIDRNKIKKDDKVKLEKMFDELFEYVKIKPTKYIVGVVYPVDSDLKRYEYRSIKTKSGGSKDSRSRLDCTTVTFMEPEELNELFENKQEFPEELLKCKCVGVYLEIYDSDDDSDDDDDDDDDDEDDDE